MITRIKIDGFKSLLQTELYFGPFTCIAGANAVGKSNFFDALSFLSKMADNSIVHAAKSIRSEQEKHSDIKDIFFKSGKDYYKTMSFEVDMIVPQKAEDDLGQDAEASITSLRYTLELAMNDDDKEGHPIQIIKEELKPMTLTETKQQLFFKKSKEWENSTIKGRRAKTPFISTEANIIKLHSDSKHKRGGRTTESIAERMPRTLLSTVTSESPTAFLARQEMRNWTMLQFEPSALRQPNTIYEVKNAEITAHGNNVPATLYRLHLEKKDEDVYQRLTNTLKNLVSNVDDIYIDKDEKRDLLTLHIRFKDGLILPAHSLSDGTLRFLGLAIIQEDTKSSGLICLEEPENGINPKKVNEMVKLLEEMSTDTDYEVNEDNPLRQVIINSHSPLVVSAVSDESLYLATEREIYSEIFQKKVKYTAFSALSGTWKTKNGLAEETTVGELLHYLETSPKKESNYKENNHYDLSGSKKKTVAENINQLYLYPEL